MEISSSCNVQDVDTDVCDDAIEPFTKEINPVASGFVRHVCEIIYWEIQASAVISEQFRHVDLWFFHFLFGVVGISWPSRCN